MADDITAAVNLIVGTTYAINNAIEQTVQGATRVVPSTTVGVGTILLKDIMTRLEAGNAQIGVEWDEREGSTGQYLLSGYDTDPAVIPTPTISVATVGNVATLSGTITAGDVVGAYRGAIGSGTAIVANDTLSTVATRLASVLTAAGVAASAVGAVVTVAGNQIATFNVGTSWTRQHESWRRRKFFYATIWAPNPFDRQVIGKTVETVYDPGARLTMPDGTAATILGMDAVGFDAVDFDEQQRDMTYVRRVRFYVDFLAVRSDLVTQVVAPTEAFTVQATGTSPTFTLPSANQL